MTVLAIALRELKSTFTTPVGWVAIAGFSLVAGVFWNFVFVENYLDRVTRFADNPYLGSDAPSLTDHLIGPYFSTLAVLLLMVAPALSMRLFSEEIRQRTIELLLTSPVSTLEIVVGKYLGALAFLALLLATTAYVPVSLALWASPDPGVLVGAYLGTFLVGAAVIALGTLLSAFTENQIAALVPTFGISVVVGLLAVFVNDPDSFAAQVSILRHATDMMEGLLHLSDLVYFAAFIGVCLLATHQRVESFRWQ